MADVRISISAEDNTKSGFSAVESGSKSAFSAIERAGSDASARISSAFEALGIKSGAAMEEQKAKVNSAYEMIKSSAVATTEEIARAEQARASAIEKIDKENFANRKTLLDQLKEHWVAVTGAITAAWLIVEKAIDYAKMGAAAEQSEESFKRVAVAYGEDADQLASKMKQASAGLIDDSELMQRAVRGLQQHLSGDQIVALLELSRTAARTAGTDVKSAFDGISTAIENQTVRALKHYGMVLDQNKAYEQYAEKLGIAKDALSEQQQTQALMNAVLEEGGRQMKAMGDITTNAAEKFQKGAVQAEELKETFGKGLLGVLAAFDAALHTVASAVLFLASGFALLIGYNPIIYFTEAGKAAREAASDLYGAAKDVGDKALGKWSAAWDQLSTAAQGGEKAHVQAAAGTKGAAKAAADAATAQENLKKQIEETTTLLPSYSQAFMQVTASKNKFAGEAFNKALTDENEHLDRNKAALDTYRSSLENIDTLTHLYSGSMDATLVRMDSYKTTQEAVNNLSLAYGQDALPMLIKSGDSYSKTMAAMTANVGVLETAFNRYISQLDAVEAEQLKYQTGVKSTLESLQETANKMSPVLGAQVTRAIAAQQGEILKVEQSGATARLGAQEKYYDELKKLQSSILQQMLDKTKEFAEMERIYLDGTKSANDVQFELWKKLASGSDVYYTTQQRNEAALTQALSLTGKERLEGINKYIQAQTQFQDEVKDGDTVVLNQYQVLQQASLNVLRGQELLNQAISEEKQAADQAGQSMQQNLDGITSRMAKVLDDMDAVRRTIVNLDLEIAKERVLSIDATKAVADVKSLIGLIQSVPGAGSGGSASPAPSWTPTGEPSYFNEGTWGGPGQSPNEFAMDTTPITSLESGTNYTARSGASNLPQGESAPAGNNSGSGERPISITFGNIVITASNKPPEELAREIVKPLSRELSKLGYLSS